jgi:phosphoglycolate phosphatase-like HAD superfamily hydrolase
MIKLVIFDLDGTLLDVSERYYLSVKNALKNFGFTCSSKSKIIKLKRQTLSGAELISMFISEDVKNREKLIKICDKERYKLLHSKDYLKLDKPFKDTYKTLKILKQKRIKIAILTLRDYKKTTIQQLKKFGLLNFFDKIILIDPRSSKNYTEVKCDSAKKICRELKVKTDECCMVGDSLNELEAGSKMNALTVGVTCGLTSGNILSQKCNKVISGVQEILNIV